MKFQRSIQSRNRAFSLVEMLLVVAVIGIIGAISVPIMGNIIAEAENSVTRRNAQVLASTASASFVAGSASVVAASSESEILDILSAGVAGTGQFDGVVYQVSLSADEKVAVDAYLVFEDGRLLYDQTGNSGN